MKEKGGSYVPISEKWLLLLLWSLERPPDRLGCGGTDAWHADRALSSDGEKSGVEWYDENEWEGRQGE